MEKWSKPIPHESTFLGSWNVFYYSKLIYLRLQPPADKVVERIKTRILDRLIHNLVINVCVIKTSLNMYIRKWIFSVVSVSAADKRKSSAVLLTTDWCSNYSEIRQNLLNTSSAISIMS